MSDIIASGNAIANVDIHCSNGLIIKQGQSVSVELQFSKKWPCGGFRTVFNSGLCFSSADAYYDCLDF